ncbi:hypothetical protein SPI_05197 [Niveomyces insectorum RCEF 264]|uniref:Uncharacterized protein n=1 Tax=Niveomyces insectorum RCEF 264 TaxID=1081102 RepID=A0A167U245_9HYPO|nr:hypothetical protein SPI_05197 [Niveomyces insectorum RCEF 264]
MTESSEPLDSWISGLLAYVFFPQSPSLAVRIISGIFVALGVAFIFPVVALIGFDICLWIWRLYSLNRHAFRRRQQQQQQQQEERRQRQQQQQQQQQQQPQQQRRQQKQQKQTQSDPPAEIVSTTSSS